MKRILALLLILLLAFGMAGAEEAPQEPPILPADKAVAEPVAQDVKPYDNYDLTRTSYEVTVPIHLPVTLRIQQPGGDVQEVLLHPAVAQITYFMETTFDGQHLCGGGIDLLNYPKLSYLGVPPYPGGTWLDQGLVPSSMAYDVQFEVLERSYGGGYGTRDGGQSCTVTHHGGSIRVTYNGVITMDALGYLISAEPVTRVISSEFGYTFRADAPEYSGKHYVPTFEEWMGVPSVPR